MRHLLIAILLIAAAEAAAIACSCISPPQTPAERQRLAREVARGASALVEAHVVSGYDVRTGRGEKLKVRRTLAGRAPPLFQVEREGRPQSPACEVEYRAGDRVLVLLYPPRRLVPGVALYKSAGSCTAYLLKDAPFRQALIAAMTARR